MASQALTSSPTLTPPTSRGLARGLGWFSIGLGVMEVLMPRTITRFLGMRGRKGLVQFYGVREIGTGVAILNSADPTPWIWGRVAGDVLDVGTVAAGLLGPRKGNKLLTLVILGGIGALDLICAEQLSRYEGP